MHYDEPQLVLGSTWYEHGSQQGMSWNAFLCTAVGVCKKLATGAIKKLVVHTAANCYSRSLAPNITDLVDFSLVSYLLSWPIRSPFSFMTATLPSHQACACPLPRAVHDFHITSVLCTSMLLSFISHMPHVNLSLFIKAVPSLWQCLMHSPYACLS